VLHEPVSVNFALVSTLGGEPDDCHFLGPEVKADITICASCLLLSIELGIVLEPLIKVLTEPKEIAVVQLVGFDRAWHRLVLEEPTQRVAGEVDSIENVLPGVVLVCTGT
tara:strand:- start:2017 stop:2346 length:330 start_codon:yes stop_codon:yes gene_type:complete